MDNAIYASLTRQSGLMREMRAVANNIANVNPVTEIARMIEVQRAYALGQSFLDQEDQRIRQAITSLTR